jgi:ABC-type multidrug transport system fused ATPase/permease subunit
VAEADEVIYMDGGRVMARGTFAELVELLPDFAVQAHLSGVST